MIESPDIIERLRNIIENGGSFMALFDRSIIQRSRALELVEVLSESLPEELEMARNLVARQEEAIEDARRQAGEIIDDAVRRAEKLVDADVITTEAKVRAEEIQRDSDEYVARQLLKMEEELTRTLSEVRAGIRAMGVRTENKPSFRVEKHSPLDMD